jgi:putative two-component system response regulator
MVKTESRIRIVDDQDVNIRLLRRMLNSAGYADVTGTPDPQEVLAMWEQSQPDLILLDLHMPHLDGLEVLEILWTRIAEAGYIPVLMLTGDMQPSVKQKALTLGAKNFLSKPFDTTEVILRINNLLQTRLLYRQLQVDKETLEVRVVERTRTLEEALVEMLERLSLASESRDDDSGEHTKRVGEMSARLARLAG